MIHDTKTRDPIEVSKPSVCNLGRRSDYEKKKLPSMIVVAFFVVWLDEGF